MRVIKIQSYGLFLSNRCFEGLWGNHDNYKSNKHMVLIMSHINTALGLTLSSFLISICGLNLWLCKKKAIKLCKEVHVFSSQCCSSWLCLCGQQNVEEGYQCRCPRGFHGRHCESSATSCRENPCKHGTCVDKEGGYECHCDPDYSGVNCEAQIDNCSSGPCLNGECLLCTQEPAQLSCV